MREIALHIMDIAENGIAAEADLVDILVSEDRSLNRLTVEITDNGKGIAEDRIDKVVDPFWTTRKTRRVGIGLSLFKAAAKQCDGDFTVSSTPGRGTRVSAFFRHDHIDRAPLGDIPATLAMMIMGNPEIDVKYTHIIDGREFTLDTRETRKIQGMSLDSATGIVHLRQTLESALTSLEQGP